MDYFYVFVKIYIKWLIICKDEKYIFLLKLKFNLWVKMLGDLFFFLFFGYDVIV